MEIMNTTLTKHCEFDRKNRVQAIIDNIGLGRIVKEVYVRSFKAIEKGQDGVYLCFTSTGITIVKDEKREKIITMYVTSYRELVRAFKGAGNIPKYLHKKVDKNQTKYIKEGKTIWQ